MEILLVRHGLPLREEKEDASLADPSLAPDGIKQAEMMADWVSKEPKPVTHIMVSPRLRAVETAADLAQTLNITPTSVDEFAEIDRSSSVYIPIEEMRTEKHPQWQKLVNRQWADAGFMDPEKFRKEVMKKFWELILKQDSNDKIVIVCHGGTINAVTATILGLKDFFFFEPAYTSISRIRTGFRGQDTDKKDKKSFHVTSLNETGHLHGIRSAS